MPLWLDGVQFGSADLPRVLRLHISGDSTSMCHPVFLTLQHFLPVLAGQHGIIRTDNTSVVYHINPHRDSGSLPSLELTLQLLTWAILVCWTWGQCICWAFGTLGWTFSHSSTNIQGNGGCTQKWYRLSGTGIAVPLCFSSHNSLSPVVIPGGSCQAHWAKMHWHMSGPRYCCMPFYHCCSYEEGTLVPPHRDRSLSATGANVAPLNPAQLHLWVRPLVGPTHC